MSNFYIKYSGIATPIEELIPSDTAQKHRIVHSDIDKPISGSNEEKYEKVAYFQYTTTAIPVALSALGGIGDMDTVTFLMIKIVDKADRENSGVNIDVLYVESGSYPISTLSGVGDFIILRPDEIHTDDIELNSTGSPAECAICDIIVGGTAA
mgnify:CR=1 FL=1